MQTDPAARGVDLGGTQSAWHHGADVALALPAVRGEHTALGGRVGLSLSGQVQCEALPVLLQAMGAQDADVRWAAADIAAHMKGDAAVVDALRLLLHNGNALQRTMAAYCLRDLDVRSQEIEAALRAALGDTHGSMLISPVPFRLRGAHATCDGAPL